MPVRSVHPPQFKLPVIYRTGVQDFLFLFIWSILIIAGPRTLHDLSCQFGTKGFSKEMRQIAGGSQSGLRKFLQQGGTSYSLALPGKVWDGQTDCSTRAQSFTCQLFHATIVSLCIGIIDLETATCESQSWRGWAWWWNVRMRGCDDVWSLVTITIITASGSQSALANWPAGHLTMTNLCSLFIKFNLLNQKPVPRLKSEL